MSSWKEIGWGVVFLVLVALSIPWFLWRSDATIAGLPAWLWWHVAWMGVTAVAFAVFARHDWGLFVTGGESPDEVRR